MPRECPPSATVTLTLRLTVKENQASHRERAWAHDLSWARQHRCTSDSLKRADQPRAELYFTQAGLSYRWENQTFPPCLCILAFVVSPFATLSDLNSNNGNTISQLMSHFDAINRTKCRCCPVNSRVTKKCRKLDVVLFSSVCLYSVSEKED